MVKPYLATTLVALMVLGGCDAGGGFSTAPKQVRVSGKEVVITGPDGFCVDPTQTKDNNTNAFVLLGSCAAIVNSRHKPTPQVRAILMATVSAQTGSVPIASSMETLARFFKSKAGRAALSRDGKPETVEVVEILGKEGILYIHAYDSSTQTLAGAGDEYWRALFDVKGRVVSASVVGLEEHPISPAAGFEVLNAFVSRIIAKNPGPAK